MWRYIILFFGFFSSSETDHFRFVTEDVYTLTGNQLSIVGQVTEGIIKREDTLVYAYKGEEYLLSIERMEIFAKSVNQNHAQKGDYVAFIISGLTKGQVPRGAVFTKKKNE